MKPESNSNPYVMFDEWKPRFHEPVIIYIKHKKKDKHQYVFTEYIDHYKWEGMGTLDAHSKWQVIAWMYVPKFIEE